MHCGNISFGLNLSTFLLVCAIGFDWRIKQVPILRWWCNYILRTVSYRWHCLSLLVVFCPFVIAGTFVQLTFISVISAILHLSRCHLRAISQSSRCHLRAISQSSQSHLAVILAISESSRSHLKATSATFY